jgi:hypothetical protein
MNIVSKILIGLILVASLGFIVLAGATLQSAGNWQKKATNYERQIEEKLAENDRLLNGGDRASLIGYRPEDGLLKMDQPDPRDRPGIRQVQVELDTLATSRGRVWRATRGEVLPTGEAQVTIEEPKAHGIKDNSVLYAFEARGPQDAGQYLGEFRVKGAAAATLALEPTIKLTDPILKRELEKINTSQPAWLLYEMMPTDDYSMFAGLSDEEIGKLLPESIRSDYLRNGKPAAETDPPEDVVDGKYVRPLWDYATLFRETHRQMWATANVIATLTVDKAHLEKAVAVATEQIQLRETEIAALKATLEKTTAERELVKTQEAAMAAELAALQARSAKLMEENKRLAQQWTREQLEAARKVDQLTELSRPAR